MYEFRCEEFHVRVDLLSQFNSLVLVPVDQMTNYWSKPSNISEMWQHQHIFTVLCAAGSKDG